MEKIVQDGKVAVLISPHYGAGWSTWNGYCSPFQPEVVQKVLDGRREEITEEFMREILGLPEDEYVCILGADDLIVEWVPEGTQFRIEEYDGSEYIVRNEDLLYTA